MARVFMPFMVDFHEAIRRGAKTATTRSKAYGKPGDVLDTHVGPILLRAVTRMPLIDIGTLWWREEAVQSPDHFAAVWEALHPRVGYDPSARKVLHLFKYLGDS